jgi:LAO/AO transport system kinase
VTAHAADPAALLDEARSGSRGALARLLSIVERGGERAEQVTRLASPLGGRAHTVGITGAPGAGKSTLVNGLCSEVRRSGDRVAVLAIDPSSPFSGGAILGDRVRMGDQADDPGVFIRSMATRGQLGGLAVATPAAVRVLDAVGVPWVLIETVGVGQVEVAIAGAADTTVVVVNPGWGDAVQANKAGLMEIADVFVVNKADRPGAAETVRDLRRMLALATTGEWTPPIVEVVATEGTGVGELCAAIVEHRRHVERSGELTSRRAQRARDEIRALVVAELARRADALTGGDGFEALVDAVVERRIDPVAAARSVLDGDALR